MIWDLTLVDFSRELLIPESPTELGLRGWMSSQEGLFYGNGEDSQALTASYLFASRDRALAAAWDYMEAHPEHKHAFIVSTDPVEDDKLEAELKEFLALEHGEI